MVDVNMSLLIDIYSELLTEKQKLSMELFYNEDYSLTEIAEHLGISRQGVHENIKQGTDKIKKFESVLCVKSKSEKRKELISKVKTAILNGNTNEALLLLGKMEDIV